MADTPTVGCATCLHKRRLIGGLVCGIRKVGDCRVGPKGLLAMTAGVGIVAMELKGYGTFFDELCLVMIGFDRGQRTFQLIIEY